MTHDCTPREVAMDPKWCKTIMCLANAVQKFEIEMSICDLTLILVLSVVHDSKSTKTKKFYHLPWALIWTNQNFPHGWCTNLGRATRKQEFHLKDTSKQHSKQNTMSKISLQLWRCFDCNCCWWWHKDWLSFVFSVAVLIIWMFLFRMCAI